MTQINSYNGGAALPGDTVTRDKIKSLTLQHNPTGDGQATDVVYSPLEGKTVPVRNLVIKDLAGNTVGMYDPLANTATEIEIPDNDKVSVEEGKTAGYLKDILVSESDMMTLAPSGNRLTVNLTLPSDVVRDSAYTHIDAATTNPLTDGTAAVGVSTKYAREDHVHPSDTSREDIANKTTVVLGTSDSKYPTDKAVAEFVNSSIDQTYSSTSTKAQSGVSVNEAFKTRETSSSDDSYTYLGMMWSGTSTEILYWKLVSFKPLNGYWALEFEIDVCNGRKGNRSFDTNIYETKRLIICSSNKDVVENAIELRYTSQSNDESRGYGNNIYYAIDSSGIVTIYIYSAKSVNKSQICRLKDVINFQSISNITWYEPVGDAGTQPSNPIKFKEAFPAIASKTSDIGSNSVPVYVNRGKPVPCNSSNLKAGKDDAGNVIKNTYATKTELNAKGITVKEISGEQVICFE